MADGVEQREDVDAVAAAGSSAVPHRVAGLELSPARARDGSAVVSLASGRHFEVSRPTARLLELIDGDRDLTAIAARLTAEAEPAIDAAALRELIERTLRPMGLVHWGDEQVPGAPARPPSPMWLRVPLVGERVVNPAAALLVPLFGRGAALLAGGLALAAHVWFYRAGPRFEFGRDLYHVAEWLPAMLLYQLSVALHELGHAAALRRHGERAGGIGFGFYRLFPVFFTDVSRAWQLPRGPRAVVDAGGMYVQVLFAGALIALTTGSHSPAFARAVGLIDLSLIANLHPILRMDGYWLVSDLSEVRDLRARSLALLRGGFGRAPGGARPSPFLIAYTLFSLVYFAAFAGWLLFGIAPRLLAQMEGAWRALRAAHGPLEALEPALFLIAGLGLALGVGWLGWNWVRQRTRR